MLAEHFGTACCALDKCEKTEPEAVVIQGKAWK